jgi:hypothetical protein
VQDRLAALRLEHEMSNHGYSSLRDCPVAIDCRLERAWDSGGSESAAWAMRRSALADL